LSQDIDLDVSITEVPHTFKVIYKLTVPSGIHQFSENRMKVPENTAAGKHPPQRFYLFSAIYPHWLFAVTWSF
jgi:hypothetical protein